MIRWDVERIEVAHSASAWSFGDVIPHGDEDIGHTFHERGERMSASDGGTTTGRVMSTASDRVLAHPLPRENHLAFF